MKYFYSVFKHKFLSSGWRQKIIFPFFLFFFLFNSFAFGSSDKRNPILIRDCTSKLEYLSEKLALPAPTLSFTTSDYNGFNISCNGGNDGSIGLTITGGIEPYEVLWSTGETTQSISNLIAGNYSVRVIDANTDTVNAQIDLTEPEQISIALERVTNVQCNAESNGSIEINVTNGVSGYIFLWSNGSTIEDQTNLIGGNYTVTVTDLNNCTSSLSQIITQPPVIEITLLGQDEICNTSNGSIQSTVLGGTPPYSLLWSNGSSNSALSGLISNTYTLTITDNNLCTASTAKTIANIPGPVATVVSQTDVSCFNGEDGSINVSVNSGTFPFTFLWSNGATIEDLINLKTGSYTIIVTDANLCTSSTGEFINQPDSISISMNITPAFGGPNGSITTIVSGGISPYSYLWSNGITNSSIINLLPGVYNLTVVDNNTCISNRDGNVPAVACSVVVDSVNNVSCFGANDGAIYITVTGAIPPTTYLWSNLSTSEDITGIAPGNYAVTVSDLFGCLVSTSAAVIEPSPLSLNIITQDETCGNNNGSITTNVSGGTTPYTYLWSNGATTSTISNLNEGTYTVTITDNNSCTKTLSGSIANFASPVLTIDSVVAARCFGQNNGGIYIAFSGGISPLTYLWSNASTNQDLQNVISGTYTVTATDANGCTATLSRAITQPAVLSATVSSTNATCGNSNGTASATPSGGTSPYTYLWSNAQTTQAVSGLTAATYTATITDNNGCTIQKTATISNLSSPTANIDSVKNVKCFGQSNGSIYISTSGGTAPFTYLWSNSATTKNLIFVVAGNYTVTVTDVNACTVQTTSSITQPVVLDATASATASTCGNSNGTASVSVSGGTVPYSFLWSNSSTNQNIAGLAASTYTVTVTDVNACSKIRSATVDNNASPVLSLDSVRNVRCFGQSSGAIYISKSGGTNPVTYLWSNGNTTQNLLAVVQGSYTVTITDNNGCTDLLTATISQPAVLSATTSSTNSTCGNANGTATASPSGGTSPYTYLWSNSRTTQTVTTLIAANYTVTVTDANSCSIIKTIAVINTAGPAAVVDSVRNVRCFGQTNGAVYISLSSGTAPFNYLWSNSSTTQDLDNVSAGGYTVTITDNNNCTTVKTSSISQPVLLNGSTSSINSTCENPNGTATISPSGGVAPYSYLWSNGQTVQTATSLSAGTYSVTLTDVNSCSITKTQTVANTPSPILAIDSIRNVSCSGNATGAIYISVSSGSSPFTYLWSNSSTNQDLVNVIAGNYSVTVTDFVGCTDTLTASITQPPVLNDSTTTTSTICGNSTGTAKVWPYGGTSPYTYLWSTAATTQQISGLSAGAYTVTITDANNCTLSAIAVVSNIGSATITLDSVRNVNCNGQSNGAIYVTVSGGTPPYSYNWSNGPTVEDNINIPAGSYTLIVLDNNNCLSTISVSVTQPTALTDSIQITRSTCGNANGSATAFGVGGTSPYSYQWSNAATTQTITNLLAGFYTVTVTDNHNCTVSSVANIGNISGPSIITDSIRNVKCFGDSTGGVFISLSGGTSPFSYLWSNSSTTQDISNIPAGIYTVTVTDNNGCTAIKTATVSQPAAALNDTPTTTSSTCGASNGTATAIPSGGTSPYTYLWSNGFTTASITNLSPGSYTITVTDFNSCSVISVALVNSIGGATITTDSIVNVKCFGQNNGAIYITPTGGTAPYTYNWSNGPNTQDNINIPAGSYTVFVFDANNCLSQKAFTVSQPAVLNDSINKSNATCGLANGSITVYPYGGTSPYTYLWSSGGQTTQTISGLSSGTYTITVTDLNGCTKISSTSITNILGPNIVLDSSVNIKCNSFSTGAIYISLAQGTGPFTYLWSTTSTSQDIVNVAAGCYTVTVTDNNNCTDTARFCLTEPTALNDSINTEAETCGAGNGSATAFPYGGTPPYTYLWNAGQTTQTISGLTSGNYPLTITDNNQCAINAIAVITNFGAPFLTGDSIRNATCNDGADGAIYITPASGTVPYSYLWSNGATTQDLIGVSANLYIVTVTDSNGCTASSPYQVNEPTAINDSIRITNATCGNANGSLTVFPYGGTGPNYTYLWSQGAQTTQTISALISNVYTVTITDQNGCTKIDSAIVGNQSGPSVITDSIINVKCNGNNTGAIFISINNGQAPFIYAWSNSTTTQDITGLVSGNYSLTVTDANNCTATKSFIITEPVALLDSIIISNATCNTANGSANVIAYGGISPYSFLWSNSSTSQSINSLIAGTYTVTITDSTGCQKTDIANISNIGGPIVTIDSVKNIICNGGNNGAIYSTSTGGAPPYQFLWSTSNSTEDILNLSAGVYTLTVTDNANCIAIISQEITEPDSLTSVINTTNASCGGSDGSATVIPSGGTFPYRYLWSNAQTTQSISNLIAGTYTVTVTDSNNCQIDTIAIVINPDAPIISNSIITNVKCFGGTNGSIDISVSGGTLNYSYLWSNTFPPLTTQDLQNDTAGTYTVTVTDAANCTVTQTFIITQPPAIQVGFAITNATCNTSNGSVATNISGGVGAFTYLWSTTQTTANISNLSAGSYTLTVTDSNLCTKSSIANVSNISAPSIIVLDSGNVSCYGSTDGFINVSVSGGVSPYFYSWTNTTQTTPFITNLAGNKNYTLTLTDSNNCIAVRSVFISEPDSIYISANIPAVNGIYNISCNGGDDGSIDINVSGGTSLYTYLWSNTATSESISNISAGIYTVTVTDARSCSKSKTFTLSEPPKLVSNAGNNFIICGINFDSLHATTPAYGTGFWNLASGTATITYPDSANTPVTNLGVGNNIIQWIVTDGICADTSQLIITVNTAIIAIAGANRSVCKDSVTLTATPPQFGFGFWEVITGNAIIGNSSVAQTSATELSLGENKFKWTVTNGNCIDSAFVTITLKDPQECREEIKLPSGITPNGDGINDVFNIKGLEDYFENSLIVFNRWGNKVFEQSPYLNNWKGENEKGEPLPESTYFVILKIKLIDKIFTGYVDVRR